MVDSSSDLGLLIEQVSYEDQTLGVEVDVLLGTRWLLHPNNHFVHLSTCYTKEGQTKATEPPEREGGAGKEEREEGGKP